MKKSEAVGSAFGLLLTVLLLLAATVILAVMLTGNKGRATEQVLADAHRIVVVDAGHGGMDGGAVAADGTLEKQINLEIARILSALLRVSGYETVMTRDGDFMLNTEDGRGSAKMRDLKKRLEIASSYPEALTVSIHCNKFPMESCKGMQVYYSDSEEAKAVADSVQSSFLSIDAKNKRQTKKTDSSIYLLYRATSPTVLVECGFLSNANELQRLKTEEYKKMLALVIMSGIDSAYKER